jgi:hypothetical protein
MPQWMSANRVGLILGVFAAAVITLPVAGALAVTGGGMMGGGWGERVAGMPGAAIGVAIGFSLVACGVVGVACVVGAAAGNLVELLVRRILRSAAH